MAHNLHNVNGWLVVGIDYHLGFHIFPPMPMMFWKLNFLHPFTLGDKAKPTVLFDGVPAVTHLHTPRYLWPHIGIIPDAMDALTPLHIARGKQRCWMPRTRVMIENEVATCCLLPGPMSINSDCWTGGMIPSSLVINVGTVVTDPEWQDFALGAMSAALDNVVLGPLAEAALSIWDWFDPAAHRHCNCANAATDIPVAPDGVDVEANVRETMAMRDRPLAERLTWFWAKVQSGGDWDYKRLHSEYEPFGNYHFGIIGKALGLPEGFLLRGAGAYQIYRKTRGEGKPWDWAGPVEPEGPVGEGRSAFGDDSRDQKMIIKGFDYLCCR